jgi:hypothetical protein
MFAESDISSRGDEFLSIANESELKDPNHSLVEAVEAGGSYSRERATGRFVL